MPAHTLEKPVPASLPTVFRDRNFLLLWLAQIISNLGDWALFVVIPVTVYNATSSKTALGLSIISGTLPALIFGLVGGVFADRWNRRRTMMVADLGRAAAILLLLGISDQKHLGARDLTLFYSVAALVSSFSCFFSPARSGLMTALLPREKLLQANGMILSGVQMTLLIGPALGGALLVWVHPRGAFVFDAATFVVSAALVGLIKNAPTPLGTKAARGLAGVWQDAREGLGFVWNSQVLRPTLALMSIALMGGWVYNTEEFAFVRDLWGGSGRQFGLLVSLAGLSALLTSLAMTGHARAAPPARLMLPGFALMAVAGVLVALAANVYIGGVMLFVMGIGTTLVNLGTMTLFQSSAPNHLQGRVIATVGLVSRLSVAVGGMVATLLTALFPGSSSLRPIFGGVAALFLLCSLLTVPLLGRVEAPARRAEGEA